MYKPQKNLPFKKIEDIDFPKGVQLQTISACNGRCIMCPYAFVEKKIEHGFMSELLFRKIVDECAAHKIEEFKPFLMNEPLLDSRLPDLLEYAREKLDVAVIGFSTNGMKMEGLMAERLANIGLNEVWFNFSGNTPETYNRVMKGLDFVTVRDNIINFSNLVARSNSGTSVNISMVEIQDSIPEIEDSITFWRDYGVMVHPIPYNNRGGNSDEINIKVLKKPVGARPCDKPTYKLCILFNGEVVLCPADWERKNIIGNVDATSISEVWNGECRKNYINDILACNYDNIALCKNCDFPLLYDD